MSNKTKKVECPNSKCKAILTITVIDGCEDKMLQCPVCNTRNQLKNYADYEPKTQLAGGENTVGRLLYKGMSYQLLEGRNLIGRKHSTSYAALQLPTDDSTMSRNHCCIEVVAVGEHKFKHIISNTENKNPTRVNEYQLREDDRLVLENGDIIKFSETEAQIQY